MQGGPTFDSLLAQPGPSAPAPQTDAAGGVSLNDPAKQAAMSNPIQQARIAAQASLAAVKSLGVAQAERMTGGL